MPFSFPSLGFEFYVVNHGEALFLVTSHPWRVILCPEFLYNRETFIVLVWDCHHLKEMTLNLSFFLESLGHTFYYRTD